jgi:LTXXQ motif family protein
MKKKVLVIGAVATAVVLVGGWALAQSHGPGFGPPFMRGEGPAGMGPGMMMQHMGRGMGPGMMQNGMGPGMMIQRMGRGMGPGMMHGGPGPAFTDPAQIESLKKELGITTTQEPAWTKYTKALQDAAATMKTAREGVDPSAVSKLTPAERFAFVSKIREQAQKQFETVKTAANELLTTLDDAQKAKAQETLPGLAFGPGSMRGAGIGGPQHRH